jgi:streptomycin 6-kinase
MLNSFEKNVTQVWGDKGHDWLKKLPNTIRILSKFWNLKNLNVVNNLSYNYVMSGEQDSKPIIIKIGCDQKDINRELIALNFYNKNNCIELLDHNLEYNALLLEQAIPGKSLASFYPNEDDKAIEITAKIIQSLHSKEIKIDLKLPSLNDEFKDLFTPHDELINSYHIKKAQELATHLLTSQSKKVLLHGDLHHDNILLSQRGYLAIDPKGIIGDHVYEICAFIRNPNPHKILKSKKLILHRLELFSEYLSIDKQRLHEWIYVKAVLEACWAMNDGQTTSDIALAEAEICEPK